MLEEKLKIKVTKDGTRTRVFLTGIVDEDAQLAPIEEICTPLVLNFKGLVQMNSVGIRIFMKSMAIVQDNGLWFEECTPAIVRQMSMVPAFLGKAQVISIYAPFACSECEADKMFLLTAEQFAGGKLHLTEEWKCEYCGKGVMEFDGNPVKYFAFAAPKS